MLNRTIAPVSKQVGEINFIEPQALQLDNGLKLFAINAGQQDLIRIEFIFPNVNWDSSRPLQSVSVNSLVNNGTKTMSAKEIADQVDYYGAFLQTDHTTDHIILTLYSLNKHLLAVLPVVKSVLNESIFPQDELDIFIQNQKQRLSVSLQKNDFLARKTFANTIFDTTSYGRDIHLTDYDALKREDALAYYKAAFKPENCTIIAAGKFGEKEFKLLNDFFGQEWENHDPSSINQFTFSAGEGSEIYIEKPDALQSAIRIGNLGINRKHADYSSLQVVNTLLGGYFGSRLMANIREDKGYTYGIGSAVVSLKDAGYFFIATEVGTEVCANAITEIEKEINLLKNTLVTAEELDLVRNYMLGSMLGSLENAFSHADKFKNIYFSGLSYSYYSNYIEKVKTISAEEIKAIANTYLNWEAMTKIVVGKK